MTVAKRSDIKRPVRKKEAIAVPELSDKDVVVRQMTLGLYLEVMSSGMSADDLNLLRVVREAQESGKPIPDAVRRSFAERGEMNPKPIPVCRVLADCVVDADEQPIFSEEEWEAWGMLHKEVPFMLYKRIEVLSGITTVEAAAKN